MRIQLGLENFLTEEQKQLLSAFDVEMRRIRNTPEHDQQFDTVIQICSDFTMSVYRHVLTRDVHLDEAEEAELRGEA